MFNPKMSIKNMNGLIAKHYKNYGITSKEFIKNLTIEDLKIYIERFKQENPDIVDSDFTNINKVGENTFDISSMYQHKLSKKLFNNRGNVL